MPRKKPTPAELIAKLKRREVMATVELRTRLKRAQQAVAAKIEAVAARTKSATSAAARNALYTEVTGVYDLAAAGIDSWMKDQVEQTAIEWHSQAKKDLKAAGAKVGSLVAFDRRLVKRYWEIVHGKNTKNLAGVFTQQMTGSDLRNLRSAFLDTFRQQTIEGWTARETHKKLQERWDRLAKNLRSDRFVDATGRPWANADYLNMLTRTTFQRVSNESYVDGIVKEGYELARIVDDGEPCQYCRAWAGLIVDISGKQRTHYPSLSQAYDGGWGHPNCGCNLEAVIPEIDGPEIDRQRKQPGADWTDPKQVQKYNDDIRIQGKRDAGMNAKDAERDLKRDKIKRELSAGLIGEHAGEIDKIPPAVLDRLPMDKIPRFEYAKKGDLATGQIASNRKSSLGGVIKIDRDNIKPEEIGRQIRFTTAKTALDEIGTIRDSRGRNVVFSSRTVAHWEKANKTTKDMDGRFAAINSAIKAVKTGTVRVRPGGTRAYTDIEADGKHGVVAFVGISGTVASWLPVSTRRNIRNWLSWPEEK